MLPNMMQGDLVHLEIGVSALKQFVHLPFPKFSQLDQFSLYSLLPKGPKPTRPKSHPTGLRILKKSPLSILNLNFNQNNVGLFSA